MTAKRIKNREIVPTEEDLVFLKALYEENLA